MTNTLLSELSHKSYDYLTSYCTPVVLPVKTDLFVAHEIPRYAYFMTSGLASIFTTSSKGKSSGISMVGREGIVGAMNLFGPQTAPTNCMIQLGATAFRISLHDLRTVFDSSNEIRDRILEMLQEQSFTISQIAACRALHKAEPRLATWLLVAQDRTQLGVLHFTQEFLAEMIGAQSVPVIAGGLQRRKMIEYSRGRVTIVSRQALESAACECYQVVKNMYEKLYNSKTSRVLSIR